jgi:hypothetical protein
MAHKRQINASLLDSVTADMLGGDDIDFFQDDSLRVERILLELIRPDPLSGAGAVRFSGSTTAAYPNAIDRD